jgi:hypothetical protein
MDKKLSITKVTRESQGHKKRRLAYSPKGMKTTCRSVPSPKDIAFGVALPIAFLSAASNTIAPNQNLPHPVKIKKEKAA